MTSIKVFKLAVDQMGISRAWPWNAKMVDNNFLFYPIYYLVMVVRELLLIALSLQLTFLIDSLVKKIRGQIL